MSPPSLLTRPRLPLILPTVRLPLAVRRTVPAASADSKVVASSSALAAAPPSATRPPARMFSPIDSLALIQMLPPLRSVLSVTSASVIEPARALRLSRPLPAFTLPSTMPAPASSVAPRPLRLAPAACVMLPRTLLKLRAPAAVTVLLALCVNSPRVFRLRLPELLMLPAKARLPRAFTLATALVPVTAKDDTDTAPWVSICTRPAPLAARLAALSTNASPSAPIAALEASVTMAACRSAKPACDTPKMLPLLVLKDAKLFTRRRSSCRLPLVSVR